MQDYGRLIPRLLCTLLTVFFLPGVTFCQLAEVTNITQWCDRVGGSITVEILDGQPQNYSYYWSHENSTNLSINNLEPGTYYFYIESKATGCSQTLEAQIADFTSCSTTEEVRWNDQECTLEIDVSFANFFGASLDPAYVNVSWDLQNLTGASVAIQLASGTSSIQVCYDYQVQGTGPQGDLNCCSGNKCLVLTNPSGPLFCAQGDTGCGLKINEVYSKTGESFLEFVVTGDEGDCEKGCDLRNVIIDDNNGDLIKDIYQDLIYTEKIDDGYVRLSNNIAWSSVPIGSLIVLHEDSKSEFFVNDPNDADGDNVYSLWIKNEDYLGGFTRPLGSTSPYYIFDGFPTAPLWDFIALDTGYDGVQTRKSSTEKQHAMILGHGNVGNVHSSGTIPVQYDPSITGGVSVKLTGGSYESGNGYTISPADITSATPGASNTPENNTFLEELRDCGKAKSFPDPGQFTAELTTYEVFPNPTNGEGMVTIKSSASTTFEFVIMSVSGQVLQRELIEVNEQTTMKLPEKFRQLPAGLYFVDLVSNGQSVGVKKIVLTK